MPRNDWPHPAQLHEGDQLIRMIEQLEAGDYPQPDYAIWRGDLPRDLAIRLARATGATDEQIAEAIADTEAAPSVPETAAAQEETAEQVSADDADLVIRHTHEDGTLIYGSVKGDGVYDALRKAGLTRGGWKYMPSIKMIGIRQSRDQLAKRWLISRAAEVLRAAGFTVAVEIDDTPRDVAQVKADQAGRLDDRYDRLTAKADRNTAKGEERRAAADRIAQRFDGGQPILAGHHSERSARADARRIDQHDRAAREALDKAERAAAAAAVVGDADAYRERPAVIIRRIDRLEAELRQTMHYINGTRPANDWRGAYGPDRKPATGERLESLNARKSFLEHQIAADREALAAHEASGYVRLTRETVHKGDIVSWSTRFGQNATVTRVNPKTVTLDRASYPRTLPYEEIRSVECPHDGTETKVTAPRRPVRPKREPVAVTRPPEREAPLTVDASTEFFPTPPAVVERMIAAADLGPDMDVLEPSAGLGAIAAKVAPLVHSVDCIERSGQLAERLRDTWPPEAGDVRCADFLEVQPNPILAYDRVLMNPPFGSQADIRHVTHALGFVKPGGLVVAVMSAGVEFRQDKTTAEFRKLVSDHGGRIERLPEDAFKPSGISVRTVMAVIPVSADSASGQDAA
jgi:predicted RNA methylase